MNRFVLPLAAFALLATVLAIGIKHSPQKGVIPSPLIGKPAPAFSLPLLTDEGRTLDSRELRGRWYLFNVWGTWCGECRQEHSVLLQIQHAGVVPLVGLDWRDDNSQARDWLTQLGNPYTAVAVDREGRTAIDWGVYGAPETFLVSPGGIVVYKYIGALTLEAWQQQFLPRIRAATSTS